VIAKILEKYADKMYPFRGYERPHNPLI